MSFGRNQRRAGGGAVYAMEAFALTSELLNRYIDICRRRVLYNLDSGRLTRVARYFFFLFLF